MMDILQKLNDIKEVIGISCTISTGAEQFHCCHIKRHKQSIEILKCQSFEDRVSLLVFLNEHKEVPIALQVQGKGVLVKEAPTLEGMTDHVLESIFPNYNKDEYVFSYFPGTEKSWVVLSRREVLENIQTALQEEGIPILRVFLGPFVADTILDQLNFYSGNYGFDGHQIKKEKGGIGWSFYTHNPENRSEYTIKVQGAELGEDFVLAYAAAFSLMMHRFVEVTHLQYEAVDYRFDEYLQSKRFRFNGLSLLVGFFVLLLLNTLVYTYYSDEYKTMNSKTRTQFSNTEELKNLMLSADSNDSLLVALGWNGGIPKSWIINQLAKTLEEAKGLNWNEIFINPIELRRTGPDALEDDNRYKIVVHGSCTHLTELEGWVNKLSNMPWIAQVEISKFIDQNSHTSKQKDFVITLQYRYDF